MTEKSNIYFDGATIKWLTVKDAKKYYSLLFKVYKQYLKLDNRQVAKAVSIAVKLCPRCKEGFGEFCCYDD